MELINIATDSVFLEHDGTRYQLEVPDWHQKDVFAKSSYLEACRQAILKSPNDTEICDPCFKLIRLGPV